MNRQSLYEMILPEQQPLQAQQVTESIIAGAEPQKFFYLDGLFLQGDVRNRNGRIYPREEIARAVAEVNEKISAHGPLPGELDHPETMSINFDRLAVAITEMRMQGSDGYGRMRVVPEGLGKIVEGAIKAGIRVGVSSRGSGNVDGDGRVADFAITTIDAVLTPSAPGAYPTASLAESLARSATGIEAMRLVEYAKYDPRAQQHLGKVLKELFVSMRDDVVWRKK